MPRKSPLAIALSIHGDSEAGRKLGSRTSKVKKKSSAANGRLGGQPPRYRLNDDALERRIGTTTRWRVLAEPYDRAAKEALRRLRAR
jgi:hypothetical protein